MNKEQILKKLRTIYEEIVLKEKIEIHLKNIDRIIIQKEKSLKEVKKALKDEEQDIKDLERKNMHNLFLTILGTHEEKYEKEKQDLLQAHLVEEALINSLEKLQQEKDKLLKDYSSKFNVEVEFEEQLKILEKVAKIDHPEIFKSLATFERNIINHKAKIKELKQATNQGEKTIRKLQRVILSMKKVEDWGMTISKRAKSNRKRALDKIQKDLQACSNYLEKFEEEIYDLSDHYGLDFIHQMEGIREFINGLFDNMITDWVLEKTMENAIHYSANTSGKIARILATLEVEINKTKAYIKDERSAKRIHVINELS